jgi:hypothetical protein
VIGAVGDGFEGAVSTGIGIQVSGVNVEAKRWVAPLTVARNLTVRPSGLQTGPKKGEAARESAFRLCAMSRSRCLEMFLGRPPVDGTR